MSVVLALAACASPPPRPDIGPGEQGLALDLTTANNGQCEMRGPGLRVSRSTILGGDYFIVGGDILRSTFVCTLDDGTRVATTSQRELFDSGQFNFGALILGPIFGPGEVEVYGYSEGPNGKVDTEGTFVFVPN